MRALLIFKTDRQNFNPDEMVVTINSMDGARPSTSRDLVGALFEWQYGALNDVPILVRIGPSATTIVLEGPEEPSLAFALALQAKIREPLNLIDSGYTFEVGLKGCASVDQLKRIIASGGQNKKFH